MPSGTFTIVPRPKSTPNSTTGKESSKSAAKLQAAAAAWTNWASQHYKGDIAPAELGAIREDEEADAARGNEEGGDYAAAWGGGDAGSSPCRPMSAAAMALITEHAGGTAASASSNSSGDIYGRAHSANAAVDREWRVAAAEIGFETAALKLSPRQELSENSPRTHALQYHQVQHTQFLREHPELIEKAAEALAAGLSATARPISPKPWNPAGNHIITPITNTVTHQDAYGQERPHSHSSPRPNPTNTTATEGESPTGTTTVAIAATTAKQQQQQLSSLHKNAATAEESEDETRDRESQLLLRRLSTPRSPREPIREVNAQKTYMVPFK